jgi:hypothetical protein
LTFTTHKKAPEKPGLELGTFGRDRPLQPAPSRVNKPLTTISATKEIAPKTTIHNLAEYSAPACNLEATRPEKPNLLAEKVASGLLATSTLVMAAGARLGITVKPG